MKDILFGKEAIIASIKKGAGFVNENKKIGSYPIAITDPSNSQSAIPGLPDTAESV